MDIACVVFNDGSEVIIREDHCKCIVGSGVVNALFGRASEPSCRIVKELIMEVGEDNCVVTTDMYGGTTIKNGQVVNYTIGKNIGKGVVVFTGIGHRPWSIKDGDRMISIDNLECL